MQMSYVSYVMVAGSVASPQILMAMLYPRDRFDIRRLIITHILHLQMSSEVSSNIVTNPVQHVEHVETFPASEKDAPASTATSEKALQESEKTPPVPKATEDNSEDEMVYPKTLQMILLTIGICLIMFMVRFELI